MENHPIYTPEPPEVSREGSPKTKLPERLHKKQLDIPGPHCSPSHPLTYTRNTRFIFWKGSRLRDTLHTWRKES